MEAEGDPKPRRAKSVSPLQSAPFSIDVLLIGGKRFATLASNVMQGVKGRAGPTVPKKEHGVPDEKKPLNEGYMKIPSSITDQFGEQFAKELYDEKKINQPANTIDVRNMENDGLQISPCSRLIRATQARTRL